MLKRTLSLAALTAALLVPAVASAATPTVAGEYPPAGLSAAPRQLTLGPDNNIWVAVETAGRPIAKVEPDGRVTEYASANISSPFGITADMAGNLWVTQQNGVARFTPADPTRAARFTINEITTPQAITVGPDDNLWTASGDSVIRIPPDDPSRAEAFDITGLGARGIASGHDGYLYVAGFSGLLARVATDGRFTTVDTRGALQEVAAGPGMQIGFTQQGTNPQYVGFFLDGALQPPALIPGTDPFGIEYGIDEAYWVANAIVDSLSRVTPEGAVTTPVSFSAGSRPEYLTAGPGGTLWVSLKQTRRIALVTGLEAPLPPVTPPVDPPVTPPTTPPSNPPVTPPPPGQQPVFTNLSLTRTTTVGRAATLRLNVAGAASVGVKVQQKASGRTSRGRCAAPSRSNRRGRRCTRWVQRQSFTAPVSNGAVSAKLSARLPAGSYRVTVSASNATGTTTATRSLTVKPKPRARARRRAGRR